MFPQQCSLSLLYTFTTNNLLYQWCGVIIIKHLQYLFRSFYSQFNQFNQWCSTNCVNKSSVRLTFLFQTLNDVLSPVINFQTGLQSTWTSAFHNSLKYRAIVIVQFALFKQLKLVSRVSFTLEKGTNTLLI